MWSKLLALPAARDIRRSADRNVLGWSVRASGRDQRAEQKDLCEDRRLGRPHKQKIRILSLNIYIHKAFNGIYLQD